MKKKSRFLKVVLAAFAGVMMFVLLFLTMLTPDQSDDCTPSGSLPASSISIDNKGKEENAKAIYAYVKEHIPDSTVEGLCGMIANFEQESQLNPSAIERQHDPLSGHGIAQWTADRTTNLKNFAAEKGKEWDDLGLQLEYLIHELNGSEKRGVAALKLTDVEEATAQWQVLFERAGIPAMGNRLAYANAWYAKFGTNDPVASGSLTTAAEGQIKEMASNCSTTSTGSGNGDIVETAKALKGYFSYSQANRTTFGDPMNPNKNGQADCSSFVWLVLTKAGYKTPAAAWATPSMAADAKGSKQFLQQIQDSEAKAGDVIVVNMGSGFGNDGHTAILIEDYHGTTTKIIEMGGYGADSVHEGQIDTSFGYLLSGDICFARPIKK